METPVKQPILSRIKRFLLKPSRKANHEDQTKGWPVLPVRLKDLSTIPFQPPPPTEEKKDY